MGLHPDLLKQVLRRLLRTPMFTLVTLITLAAGIGANTAVFSVVEGVLLNPLPYPHPEELVSVAHAAPGLNIPRLSMAPSHYFIYREQGRTFQDIGLYNGDSLSVTGVAEPEQVRGLDVTDGILPMLEIPPLLGRWFDRSDTAPGGADTVILTYGYWTRKFGADRSVIGKTITLDGKPRQIIGVMPRNFHFLDQQDPAVILPMRLDRAKTQLGNYSFQAIARLKPGVTVAQASADVARMIPIVMRSFPAPQGFSLDLFQKADLRANLQPLKSEVVGDIGKLLWILMGSIGIVLLIACANVANLFLVRAEGRQQELAIHAALGAGARRIAWELLSESLFLGLVGGALGLAMAAFGVRALVAAAPAGLPRVEDIGIDGVVVVFTIGVSLLAGLLFGLLPVAKYASPRLASVLNQGGRLGTASRQRHRARHTLVVVEIALAVILLVASGLMIRTFLALRHVEPGFVNPSQLVAMRISIPDTLVKDPEQTARTYEAIQHKLEQLPGVTSVGITSALAMEGYNSSDPIFVEDFPAPNGTIPPIRRYKQTDGSYFSTMGMRIVAGRALTWADTYHRLPVVVISETLAREYWKDPGRAIGRRVRNSPENPWRTVVGVVADERDDGLAKPAPATVYWPLIIEKFWTQDVQIRRSLAFVIRSERPKSPTLVRDVQQAVWSVNGSLPVANFRTMTEIMSASMSATSFALVMLGIAGAVALLLGVVGIYGVIAYVASQRTKEIGIRIALGAMTGDVTGLFLRQGLLLAGAGIAVGLVAAGFATRVMSTLLYGVGALDPITYVAVAAGLGLTALLASYVPAARAARVQPAVALRREI